MTRPALRILAAFVFALIFLGQGITAPFQKDDEARPAGIVLDIVNHSHWLVPVDLYGEPTRKPPLYYWLSAAVAEARGGIVDEVGVRVVPLIAAAANAVILLEVASDHLGAVSGWLAYLFLLGSYGFASRAAFGRTDMLFSSLIFAAYCTLYPATEEKESTPRSLGAGALLGLAILTKGPLALVLGALGIATYFVLIGRNPFGLAFKGWPWIVAIVALTIAASWYIPAFARNPILLRVQFVEENVGHFLPAHFGGTGEATRPYYHIVMRFLGATLPLNLYLAAALPGILRSRKSGGMLPYQTALFVAMLVFFTVASSKRDDYILYAIPPYAMVLAGPFADAAVDPAPGNSSAWLIDIVSGVAALALLILAAAGCAYLRGSVFHRLAAAMHPSDVSYVRDFVAAAGNHAVRIESTLIAIAIVSGLAIYNAFHRRSRAAAVSIALANLAVLSLWLAFLMPEYARHRTLKDFVLRARTLVGDHAVAIADVRNYGMSFYLGREVHIWPRPFVANQQPRDAAYMFVWNRDLDQLKTRLPHNSSILVSDPVLGRGRIALLRFDQPARPADAASLPAATRRHPDTR